MIYTKFISRLMLMLLLALSSSVLSAEEKKIFKISDISYADLTSSPRQDQSLDLYTIDNAKKRHVVIYVHGGGWAFGDKEQVGNKPEFFMKHNLAFISMNYRLRWDYTIYDQATDIVRVIKWVGENSEKYGLDSKHVILMGVASGAHLVSLVGSDERYLRSAGLGFKNIAAVVAVDTPSYNLNEHINNTASFLEIRHLNLIFGQEEKVLRAASPASYVAESSGMPAFALVYSKSSESHTIQTKAFAKLLTENNVDTILVPSDEDADDFDESLGVAGNRTTLALITFIRAKI